MAERPPYHFYLACLGARHGGTTGIPSVLELPARGPPLRVGRHTPGLEAHLAASPHVSRRLLEVALLGGPSEPPVEHPVHPALPHYAIRLHCHGRQPAVYLRTAWDGHPPGSALLAGTSVWLRAGDVVAIGGRVRLQLGLVPSRPDPAEPSPALRLPDGRRWGELSRERRQRLLGDVWRRHQDGPAHAWGGPIPSKDSPSRTAGDAAAEPPAEILSRETWGDAAMPSWASLPRTVEAEDAAGAPPSPPLRREEEPSASPGERLSRVSSVDPRGRSGARAASSPGRGDAVTPRRPSGSFPRRGVPLDGETMDENLNEALLHLETRSTAIHSNMFSLDQVLLGGEAVAPDSARPGESGDRPCSMLSARPSVEAARRRRRGDAPFDATNSAANTPSAKRSRRPSTSKRSPPSRGSGRRSVLSKEPWQRRPPEDDVSVRRALGGSLHSDAPLEPTRTPGPPKVTEESQEVYFRH